jgi:hypothetical protein
MKFRQKTPQQEYKLIQNDTFDFFETKKYLESLITKSLNHFKLTKIIQRKLMIEILSDVSIAIKKFLTNKENMRKRIKFSLYFTWYISQRINSIKNIKRK